MDIENEKLKIYFTTYSAVQIPCIAIFSLDLFYENNAAEG